MRRPNPRVLRGCVVVALLWWAASARAAGELVIDSQRQWQEWAFPAGTVQLSPGGRVSVGRTRKGTNPALDANTYGYDSPGGPARGGIRAAGSNPAAAALAIDGDRSTMWAPDPADDLAKWWLEVDLGRALPISEIRLVFGEAGPPFSEFRIYVSTGEPRFPGTRLRALNFLPLVRTTSPNEEQVFVQPVESADELGRPLTGALLQYVRIYFDRKVEGAALAEVEVTALGDNIAQGTLQRGGKATSGQVSLPVSIFDGLLWTGWKMTNLGSNWLQGKDLLNGPWIRWDLGAEFWIDVVRITSSGGALSTSTQAEPPMDGFRLYASTGTESAVVRHPVWQVDGRSLEWQLVADVDNTANFPTPLQNYELHYDPPLRVRYLFFHHFYGAGVWRTGYALGSDLFELQLFGEGFLPGVTLESPLLEVGDDFVSAVAWEGDFPEGTGVQLFTRSGDEVQETVTYYDKNGNEVTQESYNSIPKSFRGDIVRQRQPVEEAWSAWSPPYARSGVAFASPSPSRFLKVRATLTSDNPQTAPVLRRIALRLEDPVVKRITARIAPQEAEPGVRSPFTCLLRPVFQAGNSGFDRVLIRVPFEAEDVTVRVQDRPTDPAQLIQKADSLQIRLPVTVRNQPVEVGFTTLLERDNTVFAAAVARGDGAWQPVDPEGEGDLTVRLPAFAASPGLIHDLMVEPPVCTPNADGVNDEARVRFAVYRVDAPRPIAVEVYDLSGRLVRRLHGAAGASGLYGLRGEIAWDGRDDAGERVPPGVYLLRARVAGDAMDSVRQRPVAVAY